MALTSATAGSPWASTRKRSQIGRAEWDRPAQTPPCSTGTPVSGKPASRSAAKSSGARARRCWRSARSPVNRDASFATLS